MRPTVTVFVQYTLSALLVTAVSLTSRAQLAEPSGELVATSSRNAGWHFALGFGTVSWGSESVCNCSAVSLDAAAAYETSRGLGIEYKPTLTNTSSTVIEQALNVYLYPELGKLGAPFGLYIGAGQVLPLQDGNFERERTGSSYGYGLRARAPLGGRGKTQVFGDIGVVTFRQRFTFLNGFRAPEVEQRQVHSGLRIRIGVVW